MKDKIVDDVRTSIWLEGKDVLIRMSCGDELYATVLADDLRDRLASGESVTITLKVGPRT